MASLLGPVYPLAANPNVIFYVLLLFVALAAVFASLRLFGLFVRQRGELPPGPRPLPVIGSLLQIRQARRESSHAALSSLARYGEMATLRVGSSTWVMLNSNRVVQEIIAKRAALTSERPYLSVASGLAPIKQDIAEEKASPSFVADVLLEDPRFSNNEDEAMYLATSIVAAGSDNVRMTMNVFVMAAMCNPTVIQRARNEIDDVCGQDAERLPCLDDTSRLPYISAIVKEGLRWWPTVPVTPQHRLTQDLDFEGYRFLAGTDFVVN
ncbi:hypothetical protein MMC15_007596 [Xylographa vitiligo]|nr:hypothetical protein [Xylographa vitiligo]